MPPLFYTQEQADEYHRDMERESRPWHWLDEHATYDDAVRYYGGDTADSLDAEDRAERRERAEAAQDALEARSTLCRPDGALFFAAPGDFDYMPF